MPGIADARIEYQSNHALQVTGKSVLFSIGTDNVRGQLSVRTFAPSVTPTFWDFEACTLLQ